MRARGRSPRSAPPATRSQKPAPKSAPPNTEYAVTPKKRTTATASLQVMVGPRWSPDGHLFFDRLWRRGGSVRDVGLFAPPRFAPTPAYAPQHEDGRHADDRVDGNHREERDPDPAV